MDRATEDGVKTKLRRSSTSTDFMWTPFYLKKPFLFSMATVFFLMIIALEVVLGFSAKHNGLATVQESLYYSWKFGPTAVFTIAASLWAQVEHRAVQLMPWYQLSHSQVTAENSVLLNYLTPLRIVALWTSVKRRHWVVSIGSSGSIILGLLIILSTSLLSLEHRPITRLEGGFTILNQFNLTKELHVMSNSGAGEASRMIRNPQYYLGMHKYNLSRPRGMTNEYAFQSYEVPDTYPSPQSNTTTDAQVFASIIEDCKHFSFTIEVPENVEDLDTIPVQRWLPRDYVEEWETWCFIGQNSSSFDTPLLNERISDFSMQFSLILKCPYLNSSHEHRWMLSLTTPRFGKLSDVAVLMCKPAYSMSRRTINNQYFDRNYVLSSVGSTIHETLDLGLPPLNITAKIDASIRSGTLLGGTGSSTRWHELLNISEPQADISSFMNMTLVENLSRKVWAEFSALTVIRDFTDPADQKVDGSFTFVQGRLYVQPLTARLTQPLLGVLGLGAIAMTFISQGAFHRDPGSLGAHALILARSPRLMHLLRGYGTRSSVSATSLASKYYFSTLMDGAPRCEAIRVEPFSAVDQKTPPLERNLEPSQTWKPISLTWAYRCLMIATPLVFLTVLEILLQVSNTHNGLGNVITGGYQQYTWTYIPTLAVAAQNLLFSTADSTARMLHPYRLLTKGNVRLQEMIYDPSTQLSLPAILSAASSRQYAFVAILSTALMTPVLPIFTSGLFSPQPILWEHNVTLQLKEWFDLDKGKVDHQNTANTTNRLPAEFLFQLAQFSDMTDPKWTHEGYVFPQFNNDDLRGYSGNDTHLNITARVPAMQANMNCSFEKYLVGQNFSDPARAQLVLLEPPAGCETTRNLNSTENRPLYLMPYPYIGSGQYQDGFFVVAMYDSWHIVAYETPEELDANSTAACSDGRLHYWYAAGHQSGNMIDEISVVHCTPYVEALYATAAFILPSLTIVDGSPVIPDQASVAPVTDLTAAAAIDISLMFDFPNAIVDGYHGTPLRNLSGQANIDRFISSLERTYRSYAAFNLHLNYRRALPTQNDNDPLLDNNIDNNSFASSPFVTGPVIGIIKDGTRLRLVQSSALTRTLEAILLVLAVSAAIHVFLEREACMLPMDPGSVVGKMCLLADGKAWTLVPEGAERWSDAEIHRSGLFQGWRFRLGWWSGITEEQDRFTVDGVAVDEEGDDFDSLLCYESD